MEANPENPFPSLPTHVAGHESAISSDNNYEEPDGTQVLDAQAEIDDEEDSDEPDTDWVTFIIDNGPAQTAFASYVPTLLSTVFSDSTSIPSWSSTTTFDSEGSHHSPEDTGAEKAHQVAEDLTESDMFTQEKEQELELPPIATPMGLHQPEDAAPGTRNFSSFSDLINATKNENVEHVETPRSLSTRWLRNSHVLLRLRCHQTLR